MSGRTKASATCATSRPSCAPCRPLPPPGAPYRVTGVGLTCLDEAGASHPGIPPTTPAPLAHIKSLYRRPSAAPAAPAHHRSHMPRHSGEPSFRGSPSLPRWRQDYCTSKSLVCQLFIVLRGGRLLIVEKSKSEERRANTRQRGGDAPRCNEGNEGLKRRHMAASQLYVYGRGAR